MLAQPRLLTKPLHEARAWRRTRQAAGVAEAKELNLLVRFSGCRVGPLIAGVERLSQANRPV